jgi:hypothetical protein
MTLTLQLAVGSDLTLDRENLTIVRKFHVRGTLPYTAGGDCFDYLSSNVMGLIVASYPTYGTAMGTLYWNSIQLHENFYAQSYDISVTYSPFNRQTGTYQITVDQAVGNVRLTAGTRIAGYPTNSCPDHEGLFDDGMEVTGCDVPVAEDRIQISYRHPQAYLNASYIRNIGTLRGYPNSDLFLGYAVGEVRYMGGNFTQSDCEATATYNFEISPNVTNLVMGGITVTTKSGFDVVSPVYKHDTDVTGDGKTHAIKKLLGIEVIRPRAHKAYQPIFGWGA